MSYEPNTKETMQKIKELTSIPSPTGNTGKIIEKLAKDLDASKIPYHLNNKGGLIVTLPGKDDTKHRMLTAHVDTLGAMVKEIKADGRLLLTLIEATVLTRLKANIVPLRQVMEICIVAPY